MPVQHPIIILTHLLMKTILLDWLNLNTHPHYSYITVHSRNWHSPNFKIAIGSGKRNLSQLLLSHRQYKNVFSRSYHSSRPVYSTSGRRKRHRFTVPPPSQPDVNQAPFPCWMTSGYFSLYTSYQKPVFNATNVDCRIVASKSEGSFMYFHKDVSQPD